MSTSNQSEGRSLKFTRDVLESGRSDANDLRILAEFNYTRFNHFDELLKRYEELTTEAIELRANNSQLAGALEGTHSWVGELLDLLREIEWGGVRYYNVEGQIDEERICPSCNWLKSDGHSPDCKLFKELKS